PRRRRETSWWVPSHDPPHYRNARRRPAASIPRPGGFARIAASSSVPSLTEATGGRDNAAVPQARTRIVVVEDHPIFRDGLIKCLDAEPDFRVVGHWETGVVD